MKSSAFLLAAVAASAGFAHANVTMPAIFGDHMVLQRDTAVPLWGTADPGESVTVTAGGDKGTATAGKDGAWIVKLSKLAASSTPIGVTVAGKNTLTFHDVLVGDVWLCSGQSNMELGIRAVMPVDEFTKLAPEPQIRLFGVPKWVAPKPEPDVAPAPPLAQEGARWVVCDVDGLTKSAEWSGFSAVGYYFGHELHAYTNQPVGLIESAYGGTRIHSWMSLDMLQTMPSKVSATKGAIEFRDHYDEIKTKWETVTQPAWNAELAKWKEDNKAALDQYAADTATWQTASKAAAAAHQPAPPRPRAPKEPRPPRDPIHDSQASCALYDGMIAPLIPFAIKGAVWYQGESNAGEYPVYALELPALIKDWRNHWAQGDFPFIVVQLPNYAGPKNADGSEPWAQMREIEANAAAQLPNVGYAVTLDVGEPGNLHPTDKLDVGKRLALVAQHVAYGQTLVYCGPTFKNSAISGKEVRVTFDNVGGGLVVGAPPTHYYAAQRSVKAPVSPDTELKGFEVAGADGKFVPAAARIDGDAVVVSSDGVAEPAAARYAWANAPVCNLYNKEGLPAGTFRTAQPAAAPSPTPKTAAK
jgi:sialate O-acetylesterase